MSRRRRGALPPPPAPEPLFPTLDLHGKTADEAERAAERWLLDQQRHGEGTVRLITGRGRHSIGPPVLPSTIADLLVRLSGSVVRDYVQETGGGAYRVELTRSAAKPPRRPASEGAIDPELLLEAHRSLADLGIAPTSTLLRLEAEQIIKKRLREAD